MSRRVELRNKMGEFLARALRYLRGRASAIGEVPVVEGDTAGTLAQRRSGALAEGLLRRLFNRYRGVRYHTVVQKFLTIVSLRGLILDYKEARDKEMAHAMLQMEPASSNLQLSPPGRRSTVCPLMGLPSDPSPEQRGAKRASKKPKGSRSRGQR